ncbi:CGNR zinc finger domain-containing protein [Jiangella ureilytica]|uniref:CGNR zinc finger domain-containing protein n=1 Tax=Jiangella ureilytica TaxID=2530374 RepID=A0A4R4RHE9_9ACTN|nr:CGNR zinc finger domain-containing protein [Jiangella ureilytica]TDC47873.1 CGNR zinc finger domain-containing protein [Jiangella ureilytica]
MDVRVRPMPMDTLVELVNGWGAEPRRAGARSHVPSRADHVHRAGLPPEVADRLTDADLADFADVVFGIFARPSTAERVERISALLTGLAIRPDLVIDGDRVRPVWLTAEDDALLAAALLALRAQVAEQDPGRLGICVDGGCADVYVDISPAGRRRFCSVQCQNRARAADYRRRHRAAR